ncbi:MAG TPA: O-antigen ligase family protein [Bryobacteraceae bacterium]|nr:O-antigen ligase family protein [Bryobacteraceae bacterium]
MIDADRIRDSRPWLAGTALGVYAALAALAPGFATKALLGAPLVAIPVVWFILQAPNRWLLLFFFTALLAPPLPIALGDSGPHVALLFAAAGLWIGLLRFSEWRFRIDSVSAALLSLLGIFLASVAAAAIYSGPNVAAASLARVVLFGISVYTFVYVRDGPGSLHRRQSLRAIRWLFWAGVLTASFACVDFYFQFPAPSGYAQQFIWLESGVFRRAQGVFYEASTLGNLCAFFLEMIAVALFRPREDQPVPRSFMFVGGVALAGALVLSYSRASLLNLAVALMVLVWLHRERIRWRRLLVGASVFSVGAAGMLAFAFPIFASVYWRRVSAAFEYFWEAPNQVLSGRLDSWHTLWNFIAAEPWHLLLGIGYKTLPYSEFIGSKAIGDNTYLSLLVETGVLGLIAVVALNIAIMITARRASRSSDPVRSFCGTWMFCFWAGQVVQMFSADLLTYWRVLPVYLFVLALAGSERD